MADDFTFSSKSLIRFFANELWTFHIARAPGFGVAAQSSAVLETERLAHISPRAKKIKQADIVGNTLTIVERDPKFAAIYLPEKKAMLAVL